MKILIVCGCSGGVEKASTAYEALFKEKPKNIYKGSDNIRKLTRQFPEEANIHKYLLALAKKKGRFMYSIEYNEKGDITEMYDLITGKKVS